jgi:predicted oxidoreductase (fatty acid repression mutant protein)
MEFLESLRKRRSIYAIDKSIGIKDQELVDFIREITLNTPSAYNSESQRVVVLLKDKHDLLWEMIKEEIKKIVKPEDYKKSEEKLNSFKAGYGTVLFFDDLNTTNALIEKFPLYKANFSKWAIEQNGMLQSNIWVGLESLGIGASLQHYNELIEERVKKEFNLDKNWSLNAQMPFGKILVQPEEKQNKDIKERVLVF